MASSSQLTAVSFFLIISSLLLLSFSIISLEAAAAASPKPKALFLPVTKDAATQQYLTTFEHKTPLTTGKFAVDVGGGYLWVDCGTDYVSSSFRPVACGSPTCNAAGAFGCTTECYGTRRPGCYNNTCAGNPSNPFSNVGTSGDLGDDVLALRSVDGLKMGPLVTVPHFTFMCGSQVIVSGLAAGARGILGLGRSGVDAATQFGNAFGITKKFSVCLPSGSSQGNLFFGGGIDSSWFVGYTKLLINPVSTAGSFFQGERSVEYFVKVTGVKVGGKAIPVNSTLLDIHKGNGGTKISTVDKYTRLESSVYKAVEAAFVREAAAKGIKRVAAVKPFGACFSTANVATLYTGWAVPEIELSFEGAAAGWRMFGGSSMVDLKNGVMCLGLVDAGVNPRTTIVIGGYQLENNLLEFDLESNKMGFSSSLFFKKTICASFNVAS
ncbi:probable aspartic proteinase GIP2 [Nymphaea colorata]|uniref:Peptidase A1 domain-containing protein n=1 Tax=Nymphaea colorata TaxID=210225 RepID=A0A5K0YIP1_9MAGN|nr:probable aspartic proteinase GIP2 [Nymphaea colorata]VVV76493.1 unnamed protein product [Nymphaea colorata]